MPSKGTVRIFVDQADRQEYKRRAKACGFADRHYLHFLMRGLDAAEETCSDLQSKLAEAEEAKLRAESEADRWHAKWDTERGKRLSMTAWDHVRAAWQNGNIGDRVLMVGFALLAFGGAGHATLLVWGMI